MGNMKKLNRVWLDMCAPIVKLVMDGGCQAIFSNSEYLMRERKTQPFGLLPIIGVKVKEEITRYWW